MVAKEPAGRLPEIREELRLAPGPRLADGSPTWTLHDPVANRFYRLGWLEFELLTRWPRSGEKESSLAEIIADVAAATTLRPSLADGAHFLGFLLENFLVCLASPPPSLARQARDARARSRGGGLARYWRRLFFFPIPLCRPDPFLDTLLPWTGLFFRPVGQFILFFAALAALVLVLRQWDQFRTVLPLLFTRQGAGLAAVAFFIAKTVHELGHALAARGRGLRVPTLGVAFLFFFPVFYTDVGESWRLPRAGDRLAIAVAGSLAEAALAIVAALAWALLPAGIPRDLALLTAGLSFFSSLTINLNPLMRFDGYHILCDLLDFPNLGPRSLSLTRWRLRRLFFGIAEGPPERVTGGTESMLLAYGLASLAWRLAVVTGIALAVYHFLFKALGLVLFSLEIYFFLLQPLAAEGKFLWRHRLQAGVCRTSLLTGLVVLTGLVLVASLPIARKITVPAVLKARDFHRIYPPMAGQVEKVLVTDGAKVNEGEPLLVLSLPEMEALTKKAKARLAGLELLLERAIGGKDFFTPRQVLEERLAGVIGELAGIERQRDRLVIRAPVAGEVFDLPEGLRPGLWVRPAMKLALVVNRRNVGIEGYGQERDLATLVPGGSAVFYADAEPLVPINCVVRSIDPAGTFAAIDSFGGRGQSAGRRMQAAAGEAGVYRLTCAGGESLPAPEQIRPGTLIVTGERRRPLAAWLKHLLAIVIRESGF